MAQKQGISGFIEELRRRRVFRVAAVYGGVAFVVGEVANNYFPALNIPDWALNLVLVMMVIGFPIAIGLAWAFDITPEGIVRTEGRATGKPGTSNRALVAVTILAVVFGIWGWMRDGGGAVGEIRSIAVLPLENLMNDPEQDYFVSGMHEALTAELAKISALRVIGRSSTMRYKANPKPIPEVAEELNVDAVIEGSVLRDGDRVRITVQLVATDPERHLWSDSYDRDLKDILELHSNVARAIADEIKITLTPGEWARLTESRQVSPEAHEQYLKGMYHWNKRTEEDFNRALEHFQASIDADTLYAPAYAGLALTYELLGEYQFMPASASFPQAMAHAQEALRLDPNLAEAHTALAAARLYYRHDWERAEAGYKNALALNPGYATAYQWLGELNNYLGRHEVALANLDNALSIDPLSNAMHVVRGLTLIYLERYDEAIIQFDERETLYPGIEPSTGWHVWALIQAGRLDEAVDLDLKMLRHYSDSTGIVSARLLASYERSGFEGYARAWVSAMDQWAADAVWSLSGARRHALTGNVENTLAALENELGEKGFILLFINIFPDFEFLREEPRFQAILREIGLEP